MAKHSWRGVVGRITTAGPYPHEWFSIVVLSAVVAGGIISVAATDKAVEPEISIASLYVLPLALAALLYPLRVGIALSMLCLAMHHLVGATAKLDPRHLRHDAATFTGYLSVVLIVNRLGQQRRRLTRVAQQQRDELAAEIRLAAEVQQNILPRAVPKLAGFDLAAKMRPAKTVAGDYYGFIEQPDGAIGFVIADVSGKGVAAGLLMPSIEIALRLDSPRHAKSNEVIEEFNRVVCQLTAGCRFISLFYGKLHPASRTVEYTNAGHNPPLLIRNSSVRELTCGGPVLGVLADARYETDVVRLERGDVLVLYTDGLVEAENREGEFYSVQRLVEIASAHAHEAAAEIAERIYAAVREFRGDCDLEDDATLVILRVL
jgi:serine phosphatase RsbU (regulator of sigma subunit)